MTTAVAGGESVGGVALGRWFGPAITALRVFFGIVYLHNGLAKLLPAIPNLWPETPVGFVINAEGSRSAQSIIQYDVVTLHHPVAIYRDFIQNVVLQNFGFFGASIGLVETVVGLLLIIGLLTPIAALVAAGLSLHLQFANLWNDIWVYEYAVEWVPLLCLAALHAGRWHGLDARFARRRPRWFN